MCESYFYADLSFYINIIPYLIGVVNRYAKICHIFLPFAVLITE